MAITDNLVSYWKLDESSGNASDSVGSNTLTNNNTVTYSAQKINNGAVFASASSQSLSRTYVAGLNLTTSDFSVFNWIKFTSLPSSGNNVAVAGMFNGAASGDRAWLFYVRNNAGTYELHLYLDSGDGSATDVSVTWTPSTATLYHIGVTYNKTTGATKFYLNGTQRGATQTSDTGGPHSVLAGAPIFAVGDYYNGSAHNYLNGAIDEMGIWSRELSGGEASQLWNSGNGSQYSFTDVGIALDTAGGAYARTTGSSKTQAFTNTAGNYLVVWFATNVDVPSVTSVTYNGVAMTQLTSATGTGNSEGMYLYGLANPATGTHDVVITFGASYTFDYGIASYSGVVGTDGTFSSTNVSGGTSTATETITTTKVNTWIIAGVGLQRQATASTNSVFRSGNSTNGGCLFDNNGASTTAGSNSMQQTMSTSGTFNGVAVALYPTQPAAGPANLKSLNTNLKANIKSINTNVIANVKSLNTNT